MQSRFPLNVVVGKSAAIIELLALEDKALLVRGNALPVLDFLLNSLNGVEVVDIKVDCLVGKSLNKNLHVDAAKVQSRFLNKRSRRLRDGVRVPP
mgnify:CR=1 FL=1